MLSRVVTLQQNPSQVCTDGSLTSWASSVEDQIAARLKECCECMLASLQLTEA